jgi:hypothetical protein
LNPRRAPEEEVANVTVDDVWVFLAQPVARARQADQRRVWHVLLESVEAAGQDELVVLASQHQGRRLDHEWGGFWNEVAADWRSLVTRSECFPSVPTEHAGSTTRFAPSGKVFHQVSVGDVRVVVEGRS